MATRRPRQRRCDERGETHLERSGTGRGHFGSESEGESRSIIGDGHDREYRQLAKLVLGLENFGIDPSAVFSHSKLPDKPADLCSLGIIEC